MSPRRLLVPALCLVAGLTASCSGLRPLAGSLPSRFPDHGAPDILGALPTADSLWPAFRVQAALAFATPEESGSFAADILVRRPDSVLVRMKAPLGIEVARALVTADSVFLYDRVAKVLYAGPSDSGLLPAGLHAADLAAAFFGFDAPAPGGWTVYADSAAYHLDRNGPHGSEHLVVDPRFWRIVARDRETASGEVEERRRFSEFDRFGGLVLPRRIVTLRPLEGTRASFYVRKVEPHPADTSMDLGIRAGTRRVIIR